jgi:5,10-methylenetetrahydromethanopterin reductase
MVAYRFNRHDMRSADHFAASVRRGEALGYAVAWIPSSALLVQDPYVLLSQAARPTSHIRFGPMIENPVTRHPAVIVGSIATLNQVAGGRAELALGGELLCQ